MHRPSSSLALVLVLLAVVATAIGAAPVASANVPGSNGMLSYTFRQQDGTGVQRQAVISWVDPASGADALPEYEPPKQTDAYRPTLSGPWTVDGRIFYNVDARRFAMNSSYRGYGANPAHQSWYLGAHVGSTDSIGGTFTSGPFHPDFVDGGDLCLGRAAVVASLPDGTLLWQRYQQRSSACNVSGSGTEHTDYTITDAGAAPIRRVFDTRAGATIPGTVFGSSSEANVVYSSLAGGGTAGFYRVDLASQTSTRLSTTRPFAPTDVSPDGRSIIGIDGATQSLQRFDVATGAVTPLLTTAQADTVQPAGKVGMFTGLGQARYSPDGTQIAVVRNNSNDAGGRDAVLVLGADGSGARVARLVRPNETILADSLAWAPGQPLDVKVTGDALEGNLLKLDMSVGNAGLLPFGGMRYDAGGVEGLVLNTAPYSPELRAGYSVLAGPAPALAATLAPGATATSQYLLGIDRPGNIQVRAKAYATPLGRGEVSREDTTYVVARKRPLAKWEQVAGVGGAYADLHDQIQPAAATPVTKSYVELQKSIRKIIPKPRRNAMLLATPTEEAIARDLGLQPDDLAFLPNDPTAAKDALHAYMYGVGEGQWTYAKQHFGDLADTAFRVPFQYWTDQVTGGPYSTIPVGPALYDAGASAAAGTKSFAADAYRIVSDPRTADYLDEAVVASVDQTKARLASVPTMAPAKARQLTRRLATDPIGSARAIGFAQGQTQAAVGIAVAEGVVSPNKASAAKGIRSAGKGIERLFGLGVAEGDFTLLAMRDFANASKASRARRTLQTLADAARYGMPAADQSRWAQIVSKLEEFARIRKVDVDLQLSFRPRNLHSAEIKDLVGKNMFIEKIKAGDDIDVILGMDPHALGKNAIYNPRLPADLLDYPAPMQTRLRARAKEMKAGYQEWYNPRSAVNRAQDKNGVTLVGKLDNGASTTKIQMKVKGVERKGTIAMQYLELTDDGAKIVKKGSKPRWGGSDYDGNAFLQVDGNDLPPSVRGFLEAELMRLQRDAALTVGDVPGMATSFHGFTKNGFDIADSKYRMTYKLMMEGLTDAQAKRALDIYLKKYGDGDDYRKLLGTYTNGDFVIQVTRDGAVVAQGL